MAVTIVFETEDNDDNFARLVMKMVGNNGYATQLFGTKVTVKMVISSVSKGVCSESYSQYMVGGKTVVYRCVAQLPHTNHHFFPSP